MITCPHAHLSSQDDDELLSRIRHALRDDAEPGTPDPDDLPSIEGFRLIRLLAEGGMGRVYEAEQLHPSRRVAIKLLHSGRSGAEHRLRLFRREADALARLDHPDIAVVYSAGVSRCGEPFLAMHLAEGETLDRFAARHPLRVSDVLRLTARICRAVHHAHERGVIHRDLKPSNIMVDSNANPKVLDFGLARIAEDNPGGLARVTLDGRIAGTLAYMSPEQACATTGGVDARADVYAIGVMLFELLTGVLPINIHDRGFVQVVDAIRTEIPPEPSRLRTGIDAELDAIVLRALQKHPAHRYQSALDLANDLERRLTGLPAPSPPPRRPSRAPRWTPIPAALAFLVIAGVILGVNAGSAPLATSTATTAVAKERIHRLGPTITLIGDLSDLERDLRTRLERLRDAPNAAGQDRRAVLVRLALVLERQGRYAEAEEYFRTSLKDDRPGLQRRLLSTIALARCIGAQGRHEEANRLFSECNRMVGRLGPYENAVRTELMVAVARDRLAQRRFADARRFLDRAAACRDAAPLTAHWSRWALATAYADYFSATADPRAEQHWRLRAAAAFPQEHPYK